MEQDTSEQTTTQAIKLKKEKVIKGITCPSCGGALDLREGLKAFNCRYCSTLLVVKGESGAIKYYVPKKVSRDDAIKKAKAWLGSGMAKAKGLQANSKIDEAFLTYIPYWRVRADVVGWVFGQEEKSTSNGTTYEDKEIKIQRTYDSTFPACDVAELGVKKVNLEGDEILPVNFEDLQQQGMVFNIISSEEEIVGKARTYFSEDSKKSASLSRISFEHLDLVRNDVNVVYYPLWVIRYIYANRTYQVVVDGEDGTICYGKAPGSSLFRAIAGIYATAAGMFLATLFEIFKYSTSKLAFAAYIFCLILGISLMTWGYKKFRYGGEIEEGTGLVADEKSQFSLLKDSGTISSMLGGSPAGAAKSALASVAVGSIIGSLLSGGDD
jgi:DNA-directed RNA polymerase subunit RPC12/RpoP